MASIFNIQQDIKQHPLHDWFARTIAAHAVAPERCNFRVHASAAGVPISAPVASFSRLGFLPPHRCPSRNRRAPGRESRRRYPAPAPADATALWN